MASVLFLTALIPLRIAGAPATPASGDDDYRINVRSSVDQKYTTFSKEPPQDHGKRYAVIAFDQVKRETPLTRPVNQAALFGQLRKILSAYGFHEPEPGVNPDIVLTVLFGRSRLSNPYLEEGESVETSEYDEWFGRTPVYVPQMFNIAKQKTTPGFAEKLLSNAEEKLFIAVVAWRFPTKPKEKPKEVWRTVMVVDNPDQDLNLVSEKMLAAGGAYFDHPIANEEVTMLASVAEGHVTVGAPTVVEPKKSK